MFLKRTYTHTHAHTRTLTHVHIQIHSHEHAYTHKYMHTNILTHLHTHTHTHSHTHKRDTLSEADVSLRTVITFVTSTENRVSSLEGVLKRHLFKRCISCISIRVKCTKCILDCEVRLLRVS